MPDIPQSQLNVAELSQKKQEYFFKIIQQK